MHYIPKKTKVRIELYNNVTLPDLAIMVVGVAAVLLLITSQVEMKWTLVLVVSVFTMAMLVQVEEGVRVYKGAITLFRFFAYKRHYMLTQKPGSKKVLPSVKELIPFEGVIDDIFINYKEYFAQVIEIEPIEFGLLKEDKQKLVINTFANAVRRISHGQKMNIVKFNKAMILDKYQMVEDEKFDKLNLMHDEGQISDWELEARAPIFQNRVKVINYLNNDSKVFKDHYYIVIFDKDKESLKNTTFGIMGNLGRSSTPLASRMLEREELYVFMRSNYGNDFNERELKYFSLKEQINWVYPKEIKFKASRTEIDGESYAQYLITDYPLQVGNAWAFSFFSIKRARVKVSIEPMDKYKAERQIDISIMEMETKLSRGGKSSKQIDTQTHLETLRQLLRDLKTANESLYNVNTLITCEWSVRKEVRAILRQQGFKYTELFGRQVEGFVEGGISQAEMFGSNLRGMQTTAIGAMFPFVSGALQDEKGFYLGYNELPVFVDFFKRDNVRVNSNIIILGKSGSGKSFATKTLLANLAADNVRAFILDPEDEYTVLANNLGGKVIDVGSSVNGIINPFHMLTSLKEDEGERDDSYSQHLQFLEQFFKVIFDGMPSEAFEKLNSIVVDVYREKGITAESNLNKFKPKDFPIFDDIMLHVRKQLASMDDGYQRNLFLSIETYLSKFASGGRNANLWNGPTTITTKENFVVFNFLSLVSNRNDVIANAQMLLIFKFLQNEITKNRQYNDESIGNDRYARRKIIVAVDEAHVFINPKYPIALDFMANMAKRIRKYDGMQIVISQNIKDFVGSKEIERQSQAVINASQYSIIFSLAPNDISDLVELYRSAGQINEEEQESIVTAGLGQCFLISEPMKRTSVQIEAIPVVRDLFEKKDYYLNAQIETEN